MRWGWEEYGGAGLFQGRHPEHRGRIVLALGCKAPSAWGDWTIPAQRWRSCRRAQSHSPIERGGGQYPGLARGKNSMDHARLVQYVCLAGMARGMSIVTGIYGMERV